MYIFTVQTLKSNSQGYMQVSIIIKKCYFTGSEDCIWRIHALSLNLLFCFYMTRYK